MPRIPYPSLAGLAPSAKAIVDRSPINITRMLAGASGAISSGFAEFGSAFYTSSELPLALREIAILRVGYLCHSHYETFHHEACARALGMTDAQMAAIRTGRPEPGIFDACEQTVVDFTSDVVLNVRPTDETLGAVRRCLSDRCVLDLMLLIGCYICVCILLETTGVELDEAPLEWTKSELMKR